MACLPTENLFHSSCKQVLNASPEKLKKSVSVKFSGEDGMVGPYLFYGKVIAIKLLYVQTLCKSKQFLLLNKKYASYENQTIGNEFGFFFAA